MEHVENLRANLKRLIKDSAYSMRGASIAISEIKGRSNDSMLKDIISGKSSQPREETINDIAEFFNVTVDQLIAPNLGKDSFIAIELEGGVTAETSHPTKITTRGWSGRAITITARLSDQPNALFDLERIGDQLILFPRNAFQRTGAALPFDPSAEFYIGVVGEKEQQDICRITGLVETLTIPYNADLG